jgi:hypothetical protein
MNKNLLSALAAVILTLGASAQSDLVITELMYEPPGQQGGVGVEFMEIYNKGSLPIDMTGFRIDTTANNGVNYTFPSFTLNAGEYVCLSNDSINFQSMYGKQAFQYNGFILNVGMNVKLLDRTGNLMDSVSYLPNFPWPYHVAGKRFFHGAV